MWEEKKKKKLAQAQAILNQNSQETSSHGLTYVNIILFATIDYGFVT